MIFETLNDRGKDLSASDLLKNHLFGRADDSPQLRLMCANPPLVPASAACVEATVRVWGEALFKTQSGRWLVAAMATKGPLAAAETFVLLADERRQRGERVPASVTATAEAYRAVFAQFPHAYLTEARALLARFAATGKGTRASRPPPD